MTVGYRETMSVSFQPFSSETCISSPPLCPPVLEPRLDLRVGHLEVLGERGPLCGREILLLVEAFLELTDLDARE